MHAYYILTSILATRERVVETVVFATRSAWVRRPLFKSPIVLKFPQKTVGLLEVPPWWSIQHLTKYT
jgi:hypothetical protein